MGGIGVGSMQGCKKMGPWQGGIMTGNLETRFPQNLHPLPKYFVGVPLFDRICIDMNIFEQKMIK